VVLAAAVEAAGDLDLESRDRLGQRRGFGTQTQAKLPGETPTGGDAELAGVGAGAGRHVDDRLRARRGQPHRGKLRVERGQIPLGDEAQHDVLLDGSAEVVTAIAAGEVGERARLVRGEIAQRQREGRHGVALLPLRPHVRGPPGVEAGGQIPGLERGRQALGRSLRVRHVLEECGPAVVVGEGLALLLDKPTKLLDAELGHQELDARATAILLLAEPREHAGDTLHLRQQLFLRRELGEHLRLVGHGAEASAHHDLEAALAVHHPSHEASVVQLHQTAGLVLAAREGGLELAAEVLNVRMSQHEAHQGAGVGRDVEGLGLADARQRTRGHVAHRVAAGLAGGDAHRGETAHQVRCVFDVDEVELEVLAGGDVQDPVRILLGECGQLLELSGRHAAEGDLDALHARRIPDRVRSLGRARVEGEGLLGDPVVSLAVVVTLAVDATPQTRLGEDLLFELALLAKLDLPLEEIDLLLPAGVHATRQGFLPG
jgi:hypothetical protein